MLFISTAALKARLLAGEPTSASSRAGHYAIVQSALPLLALGHCFNHGTPEVYSLCGGLKVDWAKGAAMAATAYDLGRPFDAVKGALKRSGFGDLTTKLVNVRGNRDLALVAINEYLPSQLCAYIDGCDEETAKRITEIFSESFVTGTAAEEALDLYVTNAIVLRESYTGDKATDKSRDELAKLKAHREAKAVEPPPHEEGGVTPVAKGKAKDVAHEESPSSLGEDATPAQKKIYSQVKQLNLAAELQSQTLSIHGQQLAEGFAKAAEHHSQSEAEYLAAQAHREQEDARYHQAQLAEAEKELEEKAEKLKRLKEEQAKEKRTKDEKKVAEERLLTTMVGELKISEVRQRSAMKSINNDQTKQVLEGVEALHAKGEVELDKAFSEGVDAGMEHEAKAEKERKDAAMAKRLGGSSKVHSMAANFENAMATNSTAPPPMPPPVAAAKPRRAARFAKTDAKTD